MRDPKVSVVIAAYNAAKWLPETLESVLAQTHANREIILVDDGSTDETRDCLVAYGDRVTCLRRSHAGLAAARNAGIAASSGDYIALLDADDLWAPDKLAIQVEVALRHPQSGLVACDGIEFEGARILRSKLLARRVRMRLVNDPEVSGDFHATFIRSSCITCPAQVLFPRRIIEEIGGFGDHISQDYDFYLRASMHFQVTFHRHSLVRRRFVPEGMTGPRSGRRLLLLNSVVEVLRIHAGRSPERYRALVRRRYLRAGGEAAYFGAVAAGRGRAEAWLASLRWRRRHASDLFDDGLRIPEGRPAT